MTVNELEVTTSTANTKRYGRTVAALITRDSSVVIPSGVLVTGRLYYVTVTATSNGTDLEDRYVLPRDVPNLATSAATGAFRP